EVVPVRHYAARTLFALSLLVTLAWFDGGLRGSSSLPEPLRWSGEHRALAERSVFLAGKMSEDDTLMLTAALPASGHPGVLLFDSPTSARYTRAFLQALEAKQLLNVGTFAGDKGEVEKKYTVPAAVEFPTVAALQQALFPEAKRAV